MNFAGFRAAVAWRDDSVTVAAFGELDLDSGPELWQVLGCCLHGRIQQLVVDLSGVTFCDCSGLSVLLQAREQSLTANIDLVLVTARAPEVTQLFKLTGADTLFGLTTCTTDAAG
ncbi:STAS domain-containing protein [Streptomyces sp. NBC_00289]|uniref:STAS domain-containing protein n=1 Tax=Streptomyces sp. NBC_00289 TaxID=2975703 RepID=UPI003252A4E6